MNKIVHYLGLDVHKETFAVSIAPREQGHILTFNNWFASFNRARAVWFRFNRASYRFTAMATLAYSFKPVQAKMEPVNHLAEKFAAMPTVCGCCGRWAAFVATITDVIPPAGWFNLYRPDHDTSLLPTE